MSRKRIIRISILLLFMLIARPVAAQSDGRSFITRTGPRFGVALTTGHSADVLKQTWDARPAMLQIGWQIEGEFLANGGRISGVTSILPAIGGFDHGRILPSLTWLVGVRTEKGAQLCFGPDLSMTGAGLAVSLSSARSSGALNVPTSMTVVFGERGVRISLLTGFISGDHR
jgi:hypothetical protein